MMGTLAVKGLKYQMMETTLFYKKKTKKRKSTKLDFIPNLKSYEQAKAGVGSVFKTGRCGSYKLMVILLLSQLCINLSF